ALVGTIKDLILLALPNRGAGQVRKRVIRRLRRYEKCGAGRHLLFLSDRRNTPLSLRIRALRSRTRLLSDRRKNVLNYPGIEPSNLFKIAHMPEKSLERSFRISRYLKISSGLH